MIVPSMSHYELIKEMTIDTIAVDRKANFIADQLRRVVIKQKTKPIERWFDYKTARGNSWLLLISHHGKYHNFYRFVWFLGKHGINIIFPWTLPTGNMEYDHFTSHFIKRYNERFIKDPKLPVLETFKSYFTNNLTVNAQTDGGYESKIMGVVNDGVIFGVAEKNGQNLYITYKTFVSNQMILEFQQSDIQQLQDFKNGKSFNLLSESRNGIPVWKQSVNWEFLKED